MRSCGSGARASPSGSAAPASGSSTGVGGGGTCPPEPGGAIPDLKLTLVAPGLFKPVFATAAPGDPSRLYIVEQNGRIRIVKDGSLLAAPFLDITNLSSSASDSNSERGTLGLAFHPDYQNNGRFIVYYSVSGELHNVLVEFALA